MSILIKGIKLPTPPDELRLIIRPNGQVIICHRTEWDETEVVNVPPHGRLIDADKLTLTDIDIALCEDYKSLLSSYINKVENAPTVIEAEEGGE